MDRPMRIHMECVIGALGEAVVGDDRGVYTLVVLPTRWPHLIPGLVIPSDVTTLKEIVKGIKGN